MTSLTTNIPGNYHAIIYSTQHKDPSIMTNNIMLQKSPAPRPWVRITGPRWSWYWETSVYSRTQKYAFFLKYYAFFINITFFFVWKVVFTLLNAIKRFDCSESFRVKSGGIIAVKFFNLYFFWVCNWLVDNNIPIKKEYDRSHPYSIRTGCFTCCQNPDENVIARTDVLSAQYKFII